LLDVFRSRRDLVLENLALRQQLDVLGCIDIYKLLMIQFENCHPEGSWKRSLPLTQPKKLPASSAPFCLPRFACPVLPKITRRCCTIA
jgi:hypothetical protein